MEETEYVLALEPDTEDFHFDSDSSGSSPLSPNIPSMPRTRSMKEWQVDVDDMLSANSGQSKEEDKVGYDAEKETRKRIVMEVESTTDPCVNTTAAHEQELDRRRWGFPQLRPLMYSGTVDSEKEGVICTSITLSSGKVLGGQVSEASQAVRKLPRELYREMKKFENLATRLEQEGQKVNVWQQKITRMFCQHIDRIQTARKREYDAYKKREETLIKARNKLMAQNKELRQALEGHGSALTFTRADLENM
jgi:hypothetical protein